MAQKKWYEVLFSNFGRTYDSEAFTRGTQGECDFIEKEIGYNKNLRILDVGCGTGRHTIELTKRGYNVTGIDLSESMLNIAREKAAAAGIDIVFMKCDARHLPFEEEFDVAIMLCEGAFPLMETDEMNYEILRNVAKSLRGKCRFIFTTLNGLFPVFHSVGKFKDENPGEEAHSIQNNTFNIMTLRDQSITEIADDSGKKRLIESNERYYMPSEITWLLKSLGFKKTDIFGAKLGAFSRNDQLTSNDFEMLVIAER